MNSPVVTVFQNEQEKKQDFDMFVGVPFTNFEKKIASSNSFIATREDEAIGIAAGAALCGRKPLVFMQNSGLGNCFDIITSLLKPYKIEVDLLVDNRIEPEHHALMGRVCKQLMEVVGYDKIKYC